MKRYHLDTTITKLSGPTKEQIIVQNQWAASALDKFHKASTATVEFNIDGTVIKTNLRWNSSFSKAAMKEKIDIANQGGVAMAWFVMAVLLDYNYVEQTEIGTGVDYRFRKNEPDDDDLNFLDDFCYVEVSGLLEETKSNTLKERIKDKHNQINKGSKRTKTSSVIVTLFSKPITVKEVHK